MKFTWGEAKSTTGWPISKLLLPSKEVDFFLFAYYDTFTTIELSFFITLNFRSCTVKEIGKLEFLFFKKDLEHGLLRSIFADC